MDKLTREHGIETPTHTKTLGAFNPNIISIETKTNRRCFNPSPNKGAIYLLSIYLTAIYDDNYDFSNIGTVVQSKILIFFPFYYMLIYRNIFKDVLLTL